VEAVELLTCTVNDAVRPDDLLTALAHQGAAVGARIYEAALETAPNHASAGDPEDLLAVRTGDVRSCWRVSDGVIPSAAAPSSVPSRCDIAR
jgi:hypothetical protein